jgi:phage baseplate assembly protein W
MSDQFIGRGWAFPVHADPVTGSIALVSKDREIAESIRLILGTSYGERPMRPEFGSAINEFVFAPADPGTAGLIAYEVRRALTRWEPRIRVIGVEVTLDSVDRSKFLIDISYTVRPDNNPRNLVFPFYAIPSDDGGTHGGPPTPIPSAGA